MLIDIHRHSKDKGKADIVLQNLFHDQTDQCKEDGYFSLGLHPWHVKQNSLEEDLNTIAYYAEKSNILAIGEAGLDKSVNIDLDLQRKAFKSQIEIAKTTNKAMIIHCVHAYDELQLFRKQNQKDQPWIIHWYNSSPQTGRDLINKGCFLSFGHTLFAKNSKAYKTFVETPLEYIFLETDDVELGLDDIYEQAAKIKKIELAELQQQLIKNFNNCFRINL